MERRKIADEAEARGSLAAVAKAGIGIRDWARAQGIDGRSLHAWDMVLRRKKGRGKAQSRKSTLVELVPARTEAPAACYVMWVGDVAVEFGDDVREETLRRVLTVLRSC
jgi:hypothetical protein